jgi:Putative beta-lactamase-inhibitor-like, PepSY-like
MAAKFDPKGKWLETETTIEQSELTKDIRAAISTDYKDYKIIETQKVERADDKRILFEVHLESAEEILKLQFDGNGTVSSKSAKRKQGL